ncbi:SpvB/TcaC N-terminal domain-containing protein [Bacillus toyonensis]|uniref:SpvB/TcaC N-terminal domain-containing protein n=1 Tax=Bacillus toyonensis TaxID=155322 RepID=UPI00119F803A|nr:SpvB/TcaC N-terminal domain-containing protein [Bacillus toyonensis]
MAVSDVNEGQSKDEHVLKVPSISLPKGGGAIRGIGEKFGANPITGTGTMSVPIVTSPGRAGFSPQLALSYNSGAGNGPFGLGWNLALPVITRKTDKGLPRYLDAQESDVFIFSGAEDLVPVLIKDASENWTSEKLQPRIINGTEYYIHRYRPRVEGLFARIERWSNAEKPDDVFWRSISKDNVTTWYGKDENSRIFDPESPERIFSWLICQSHDDKGNIITYRYKAEDAGNIDLSQACEKNRGGEMDMQRTANRYLKRIRYGNHAPYLPKLEADQPWPKLPSDDSWYFEVVFDYGEHNMDNPTPEETGKWASRLDPFSSYRSTFEVRTYRLCQRVLMFHHIPNDSHDPDSQKGYGGLVNSTDFTYEYEKDTANSRAPIFSKLTEVTQRGYQLTPNGDYVSQQLPPLEFTYSDAIIQTEMRELNDDSLENLPIGIDGALYQWVDLNGEGLSGVLSEQAGAWYYKRNLSPINAIDSNAVTHIEAKLAPMELVSTKPAIALTDGTQFLDLAGDGRPDAVQFAGSTPGFYDRTIDGQWAPFTPINSLPNISWSDPNLKFIDLDGDGQADILISEHDVFVWHPSLGEEGFGAAQRVNKFWDEEKGPSIVFSDGEQSIYVSDMSGDGLSDIVRISCYGEVCYWPNLGYGRFGAKVTMDNALLFDHIDQFDHRRIRLADIDGTGTTDLLYLSREGVRVHFNQSGNSWSAATTITCFPTLDNVVDVQALDLLGNGTACLVWSSPLPGDMCRQLRYLDLMGGQKPHLLIKMVNNLGTETTVEYAPSTKFYLQDKQADKPWITKLPFPVHCVEKVTLHDRWRKTNFSTTYSYHHGHFDGAEREFCGFGRVEQVDVEDYGTFEVGNINSPYITDEKKLYQPPVKTVTWFHTGVFLDRSVTVSHYKDEYFPNWFENEKPDMQVLGVFRENELPDPELDIADLTPDEWREALRACKGMMLRQEVYELDVDSFVNRTHNPVKLYSAAYHNCHIHRVQPKAFNQHVVFHVTESEAIIYHYELDLRHDKLTPDPRIVHTLNLSIDEFGNIQQSVTVVYPRRSKYEDDTLKDDELKLIRHLQNELHLSYTETRYTNDVPEPANLDLDNYRLRLPCEVMTYELTGKLIDVNFQGDDLADRYFTLEELRDYRLSETYQNSGKTVEELAYHLLPDSDGRPQKRLVEHWRTLFFNITLDEPLMLGKLNALALPYENYKLALTDDILDLVFKNKITLDIQTALTDKKKGGYLTGSELLDRFGTNSAGQYWMCSGVAGFNVDARDHFYLPERYTDPFGNQTLLSYDSRNLYIQSSTDALGNRTKVMDFDFRVLAPCRMKDLNDNLSEVRFDVLGMPAAMAMMGKGAEADNLIDFDNVLLNMDLVNRQNFFVNNDYTVADAENLLRGASARHMYYFGEVIRDGKIVWGQHPACACGIVRERHFVDEPDSRVQCAFEYSDGSGNVIVKKVQAEPEESGGAMRWIASGKTILNNKGKPVKQFEPYFSPLAVGHRYEEPAEMGVTPVMYYDAVGRLIRTESPDDSYSRVEFSPWHVKQYDANDTVMEDNNAWFKRMSDPTASVEDRRASRLAAEHTNTPSVTVLDSLGRDVVTIAHNRMGPADAPVNEKYVTFTKLDAEGKPLWVQDSRGNRVLQYIMPPLPNGFHPFNDPNNLNPQEFSPCYDIAGNLLYQHSMDAGDHWMLNDAAGKPMFAWNSREFLTRMIYDRLHRPTGSFVTGTDLVNPEREIQFERLVYGEEWAEEEGKQRNLRGKLYKHFDTAGIVTSEAYDFKGNPLRTIRRLTVDYKGIPDWSQNPLLEEEHFMARTLYDSLNRPIQIIAPYSMMVNPQRINIFQPQYNAAGLLERVDVWLNQSTESAMLLDPRTATQHVVKNVAYNEKGQRERILYGNGSETIYDYDRKNFRLQRMTTIRKSDEVPLQDLRYTYDPIGNIIQIRDSTNDRVFHSNQCVLPGAEYRYDALYRLIAASGREHKGNGQQNEWDDRSRFESTLPNDCQALQNYVETYRYDEVGNIMQMVHHLGRNLEQPGQVMWNRRYQYALDSNRLLATSLPGDSDALSGYVVTPGDYRAKYTYDLSGSMTSMPHLPQISWNFKDQLSATSGMVMNSSSTLDRMSVKTYYVYNAAGQRIRKVTDTQTGALSKQRIYLGSFEVYREYSNDGAVSLERESLHVMDDTRRVALIENQTIKHQAVIANPQPLVRYQLSNHLDSVSLELDENASVITYEEYTPYGSTAYCSGRGAAEVSLKRYRYTGKERDEETGFSYHGARYYVLWLGRWLSSDPMNLIDGGNLFAYVRGNPIRLVDQTGTQGNLTKGAQQAMDEYRQEKNRQVEQNSDAYPKAEDVPKNLIYPKHPSTNTVLQQQRSLKQAEANRAQTKPATIVTKEEKFEAAKAGATNWLLDKVTEGVGKTAGVSKLPFVEETATNAAKAVLKPLYAPDPQKFSINVRELEMKENYEAARTTLTVAETAVTFLPLGEIVQSARLAAGKLPELYGIGMGGGKLVGFSEQWAASAKTITTVPKIGPLQVFRPINKGESFLDYGKAMHEHGLIKYFELRYPDAKVTLNTLPGVTGPDVEVAFENGCAPINFKFGELKTIRTPINDIQKQAELNWGYEMGEGRLFFYDRRGYMMEGVVDRPLF